MRLHGLFRHGFPWATLSLWKERFSDTSLLFHLYLIPFTFMANLATGAKVATVLLSAVCFTSFYWVLRANGVKQAVFWLFVLFISGPFFLWRIDVPRPQILSVTLMLWCVHFLINARRKPLALLSFAYALSYSAAFFPFVFAVIRSVHLYVVEHEWDWKTPAAAFGGFAAGMLVNPYFPHDLLMLYLQNIYVLKMTIAGGEQLGMGGECYPMDTRMLLVAQLAVVAALLLVGYAGLASGRKPGRKAGELLPMALATIVMTMLWKRFTEYSVPLTLLYCGFRAEELLSLGESSGYFRRHPRRRRAALAAGVVFLGCCAVGSTREIMLDFRGTQVSVLKGAALFVKAHARPDETVFTCDWDDAPELFFYDDEQRYLVFLDPVFMYYWDRGVWSRWHEAANGNLGRETAATIREISGARYGVCKERFSNLHRVIENDPKMKIVYDDGQSYVFEL